MTVVWAIGAKGQSPAREYFQALSDPERAKMMALFTRLADTRRIANQEKFKCLGQRGGNLWEFKSYQLRFLGDFRAGAFFVISHGLRKKGDDLRKADVETALRILEEDDQWEKNHDHHH